MAKAAIITREAPAFTKAQLMASNKYKARGDLISALLMDEKTYTSSEVDKLIENYMKGKVI